MLKFAKTYSPELVETRRLREEIAPVLEDNSLSENRINDLILVLVEAFTNIVRHAKPLPSEIAVSVETADGNLNITLSDDGPGFTGFEAAREKALSLGDLSMMEHGMGLNLIFSLTSSVSYLPSESRNALLVREPLPASERKTIVAIDDDPVGLKLIEAFLGDRYAVHSFNKGSEALDHINREHPDLIISDIDMPDLNGLELRESLRCDPATALIPFIFLTGVVDEDIHDEANDLDIDDFMEKPTSKGKLVRTVDRTLKRSTRIRQSATAAFEASVTNSLRSNTPAELGRFRFFSEEIAASAGGGDFMVHVSGEDFLSVVLLDVMGHGIPAKVFAHAYSGYVQSIMSLDETARDPARVLQELSSHVARDTRLTSTIVTAIAATFSDSGKVLVASAGHPRPLLYMQGTGWRPVPISGVLPGLSDELPETKTIQLGSGDGLLLFTDGISEVLCRERPEDALLSALEGLPPPDGGTLAKLNEIADKAGHGREQDQDDRSTFLAIAR
ncbi:SpoIIE family protein phosphatase [Nisaea nitritireducens]|uniref:SpoIIE family protein phosphatase n=1 Tax=Nisaea nitritireducens TaxID=568392 RepID=UPI001868AF8E|nr:SpoIIE family protein phosphatase [Nisaea nitritireducens]